MAKKSPTTKATQTPAKLVFQRAEAASKLEERIVTGQDLLGRQIRTKADLEVTQQEHYTWNDYNRELLARMFDGPQYRDEYDSWGAMSVPMNPSLGDLIRRLQEDIQTDMRKLRSLKDRLDLIEVIAPAPTAPTTGANASHSTRVFVVHGHDDALKQEVARFVERLGLQAIILAEQANNGRTIIEKFEAHAETAGFAVVLLTPDDLGGARQSTPQRLRARQNVILELGYFIGKLGRARVCALHKGDVELPSDIHGVVYVSADGDWRLPLAKEMRTAKLPVDLNRALD